jgi:hypothetical protein
VKASLESAKRKLEEERAETADQERRRAVLEWLENYRKEEKSDEV